MHAKHKQIIVMGVPTSGKSTFTREVARKLGVSRMEIDPIIEAFETVFPEHGITHNANTLASHSQVCENFKPFLFRMIDGMTDDDFIIEGFRMPIEDIHQRYGKTHQIFCFGYPSATLEEKFVDCRKFDTGNWTNELSDEELKDVLAFLLEQTKIEKQTCEKLGITFFDTSKSYLQVIQSALESVH
jgi:hypothetical protein